MRANLKFELIKTGRPAWKIAREIGIRADLLSRITTGSSDPHPDVRAKIAGYFRTDPEHLFQIFENVEDRGIPD